MKISIAKDFTKTPGFRFESEGPYSGEEFRKTMLENFFRDPQNKEEIIIDLDGVEGYATSFLEETFGGLARLFGIETVEKRIKFISKEEPLLIDEISLYIRKCNEKK